MSEDGEVVMLRGDRLTMTWTLKNVVNAKEGDEYTLMVHVSDNRGNIPRHYFNVLVDEPTTIEVELLDHLDLHPYLHAELFLTTSRDDLDGATSQCLFAYGHTPLYPAIFNRGHSATQITLTDITEVTQGTLYVSSISPPSPPPPSDPLPPLLQLTPKQQSYMDVFPSVWYSEEANIEINLQKQGYSHLVTPIGNVPLICFPMMTTMIDPTYWDQPPEELYLIWNHFLYMAIKRLGYNYRSLVNKKIDLEDEKEVNRTLKILCEMFCLISHGHLFVDDRTRASFDKIIPIDWWTNLSLYPNPGLIGRDCEDATGFVYQLVHIFLHLPLSDSDYDQDPNLAFLYRSQTLLRKYTCFVTLGTQYVGPDPDSYAPHAYITLHESTYVDQLRNGSNHTPSYLPSILLDTVNYIEPLWIESEWTESEEYQQRIRDSKLEEEFIEEYDSSLRRFLKPYVLSHRLNENQEYGDISHMLTINHKGHGLHWMMKQPPSIAQPSKKFKVGYPLEDLMLKKATHRNVQEVLLLTPQDIQALHQALINLPWSQMIPFGYTLHDTQVHAASLHTYTQQLKRERKGKGDHKVSFLIRTIDYQGRRKQEIDDALRSFFPLAPKIWAYAYHVTSEISFTELTLFFS
jgi:hypothetical protein